MLCLPAGWQHLLQTHHSRHAVDAVTDGCDLALLQLHTAASLHLVAVEAAEQSCNRTKSQFSAQVGMAAGLLLLLG
jgi:hypothetical protein